MKNDPKVIRGWCMYDWANSAFALTIVSAIFPEYYVGVTSTTLAGGLADDHITFLGFEWINTVLLTYVTSLSFLLMAIVGPILTGIADATGRKKIYMQIFCYIGVLGCAMLALFDGDHLGLGILGYMLGLIGFGASILFYNSFLPDIATEDKLDKISARGFALGYVGSVILLVFNLAVIMLPDVFHLTSSEASRLAFLTVGLWWAGWAQWPFSVLPSRSHAPSVDGKVNSQTLVKGFQELVKTFKAAMKTEGLSAFLPSFFFYNMGVQTIMLVAPLFAKKELGVPTAGLIGTILLLQLIAIPGALGASWLSSRMGNKPVLVLLVMLWCLITIAAVYTSTPEQFYGLAAAVGLIMGGSQSLSRSSYAKMIPVGNADTASFFSFYDSTEKLSIIIGTFAYALIEQLTGSMRLSVLALLSFFVIGLLLLNRLPKLKVLAPLNG
jgi:MFS transporter, UMF1 family